MRDGLKIPPNIEISESELEEQFIRSSGPGGQNVNKVATAVQLRFDAANSPSLSARVRDRTIALAGQRATKDGVIVIEAGRFRTQEQNREDAIARLVALIYQATEKPKPRKKTRPSAASQAERIEEKKRRGAIKRARSAQPHEFE